MGKKVLIVEDNIDTVTTMRLVLERAGYAVEAAFDGEQGLKRVREWQPDIILLDMMMPIMDGYTMNQHLKEDPALRAIPVIVVSARSGMGPLFEADPKVKVDGYLVKPITSNVLCATVEKVLASVGR